jgi:hypothetical protein
MVMRGREVRRLGVVDITDPVSIANAAAAGRPVQDIPADNEVDDPNHLDQAEHPGVIDVRPRAAVARSPLVGRESTTTRRLAELERIARRLAALDPYLETIDDETFCAFCDTFGGSHERDCVWLLADTWVRRHTP